MRDETNDAMMNDMDGRGGRDRRARRPAFRRKVCKFCTSPQGPDYNNTRELGLLLYSSYLYPFEIAAVILLVAIVAAIRLTLRHRPDTKYLDPSKQVYVRKGPDRVQLIRVPPEPRRVPPTATPTSGVEDEA